MKLPLFSPTNTALPTRSAQGTPSAPPVDPTGAGLAQIGRDLMQSGRQFGVIAAQDARDQAAADAHAERLRAAAEKAKQAYLDDIDATTDLNGTKDELAVIQRTMTRGVRDPDTDEVIEAPVGPRDFMDEYEKRTNVVRNRLLSKDRTPGAQDRVRKESLRIFGERTLAARTQADALAADYYGGKLEQNLEDIERQAGTEMDPDKQAALEQDLSTVLKKSAGMKSQEWIQKRARLSEERIDTTRARLLAEQDPAGVIAALRGPAKDSPYRLEPDKATALATTLEGEWRTRVKDEEVRSRARTEAWEKAWHGYQSTQYVDDYLAMRENRLSTDQAKQNARDWHYTPAQVKELLDGIEQPAKEAKSDPGTRMLVFADVNGMNPQITEGQIKTLMANGSLDTNDGSTALRALTARKREQETDRRSAETTARVAENTAIARQNHQESTMRFYHAQADGQLKAAMGIPDVLPPGFSPEVFAAYSQARQQLANRSAAFPINGGKENPMAVVREIIPQAQQAGGIFGRVKEKELIKVLQGQDPELAKLATQGPDGFLEAARRLDAKRRTLGEAEFGRIAQVFAELRELYRALEGSGAISAPTPSTATPSGASGGFAVPKAPKGSR